MTTHKRDLLVELLLADELSPDQQQQLSALIADDERIREEVFDQMWLEPLLRDHFSGDPDAFVLRIETVLNNELDSADFTDRVLDKWAERLSQRARARFLRWGSGIVAAAVLVLAMVAYFPGGSTVEAAQSVRIQHATGLVEVEAADGTVRSANFGTVILPGETIRTSGASSTTISCPDKSRIVLTRDASLTWPEDSTTRVVLNHGLAHIVRSANRQVSSKPSPVVLATQHATIDVPECELMLATSEQRTDITVYRGTAVVTSIDGRTATVSRGECGIAGPQELLVRRGAATPDSWSEGFENGLPKGWQATFVSTELPGRSHGAAQTTATTTEEGEDCHQLWSYSDWQHGLAVVHADTCLNFVYRFKTADTVQVLTLLRSAIPDSPDYEVQILEPADVPEDERWWIVPENEWYTVSIPLSRLRNPVSLRRPAESLIATAFNFRAQDHACRLAIDRMWLERGTSDKIEFKPVE